MSLHTPLYEEHLKAGGKMVPFAGYELPVQYATGVIKEHLAVRNECGLFDVSHMGEILLSGNSATDYLNHLLTNDYNVMDIGRARYSPMCNESGGCVDDLIVYKRGENDYFIVVNAANKDKDFEWMKAHLIGDASVSDVSDEYAQIALQGPKAKDIIALLTPDELIPKKYYSAVFNSKIGDFDCILSRTGYTGSFGYEIYCKALAAPSIWNLLLKTGEPFGLIPCGLGARDTLRLEAAMPLYGHEMDDNTTPLEAGLGFAVKMNKPSFIGKSGIEAKMPPARERIGLKVTGRGIVREHQEVYSLSGELIGMTTSGTHAPLLGYPIAMALVKANSVKIGDRVNVNVRSRNVEAEVVAMPFYKI